VDGNAGHFGKEAQNLAPLVR